ncbi:hypothetical protein [Paracraurococcus lichenis]|uniref:Uncharacterized protein n=1 Tax=Paracraurococcus lichenis TaxID=3064888 RepID=A0ABT9E8M0_9PROT|nr:hypothetical protein [Paracraurococcus sp. LOR1-02]MDO9712556.1 hypothetical protein [Paracraurococcus sp. LOR1-02]
MEAKEVRQAKARVEQRERDFVQQTVAQGRQLRERSAAAAATQEQRAAQAEGAQQRLARRRDDADQQGQGV